MIRAYNRHSRVQVGQPPDSPFSFVRMLYDADIYNPLELEKSTAPQTQSATNDSQNHQPNATDKPLGVWVDEVMERFRKRKAEAIARHQMECDSLSAVQRMEWEGMLKRLKASGVTTHLPQQYDSYVPAVEIIRDFVILPQ